MSTHRLAGSVPACGMLCGACLSGCGFHLRGSEALPAGMSVTYIQSGQPFSSLVDDFTDALGTVACR